MLITYKTFIMNKLERIKKAVKMAVALGYGKNQAEIGRLLGYNNGAAFSHVLNGVDKMPINFLDKLQSVLPTLNIEWIETGQGEIFKDKAIPQNTAIHSAGDVAMYNSQIHHDNLAATLQRLTDEIAEQRRTYTELLAAKDAQIAQKDAQISQLLNLLSK